LNFRGFECVESFESFIREFLENFRVSEFQFQKSCLAKVFKVSFESFRVSDFESFRVREISSESFL
jgi:hypothetical protein